MRIFDNVEPFLGKTNFVDKNNVVVGFNEDGQCCEDFGWFFSTEPAKSKNYKEINQPENLEEFIFDKDFYEENYDNDGGLISFRLINQNEIIYLNLYNYQNGYYSHGFGFSVDGKVVLVGSI